MNKTVLFALLFLVGCQPVAPPVSPVDAPPFVEPSVSALDSLYQHTQTELAAITGGINPARYEEISAQITELAQGGYPVEKVQLLNDTLQEWQAKSVQPSLAPEKKTEQEILSCQSNPAPVFTHHITDIAKVDRILTPPRIVSGSLKTHSYVETKKQRVPVYAPVDMLLTSGAHYIGGPYWFEFKVSCEVTLRFGHITDPLPTIKAVFPREPADDSRDQPVETPIAFTAGDLLGYTTGTELAGNWDFGVYHVATSNKYAGSEWGNSSVYTTAVCPYDYFIPSLKKEYVALYDFRDVGSASTDGESFCSL